MGTEVTLFSRDSIQSVVVTAKNSVSSIDSHTYHLLLLLVYIYIVYDVYWNQNILVEKCTQYGY